MRVIAIDPGENTGWAIGAVVDGKLHVTAFGYDPWKKFCMNYMDVMDGDNSFDVVVFESWRLRASEMKALLGSDLPSSQCIGVIKYGAWKHKKQLVTSEPSNKPVIDGQMGGTDYLPGRDGAEHHRDAVRHLAWWFVNKYDGSPKDVRFYFDKGAQ